MVAALAAEHAPQGPTEEHLVEELAGILWRKRRLRLAEAAAHHRGLEDTLSPFRRTKEAALAYVGVSNPSEDVSDVISVTATDTEAEQADIAADEAITRRALDLLGSRRKDAYEVALAALREDTRDWWADELARDPAELEEDEVPATPTPRACASSSKRRCCRGSRRAGRNWPTGR